MKYFISTLGCQQNVHDSERLRILFNKLSFVESDEKNASLIVILACSVRQKAVDRVFGMIRNWQKNSPSDDSLCQNNKDCHHNSLSPTILMTACVLESDKKKFKDKGVVFFNIEDLNSLKSLLDLKINDDFNELADNQSNSAYLPIMTGCNNFCSYCVVPYTRGREKSRPVDDIVNDFNKLIRARHREITLLGQNVNSFQISPKSKVLSPQILSFPRRRESLPAGRQVLNQSLDPCLRRDDKWRGGNDNGAGGYDSIAGGNYIIKKSDFARLLHILNDIPGNFTIKFMSNHPKDMTDDLIEAIAILPKVVKQIHLPLQSGSDQILKAMNRHYTKDQYLKLISKIKAQISNVEITTDIIVGFPGESEKDFQDTVEIARKANFALAYISPYSPRSGTPADKMDDDVPQATKKARFRTLDKLINKH